MDIRLYDTNYGDCFVVDAFPESGEKSVKLLFDVGRTPSKEQIEDFKDINGIIVTHVDADHIVGLIKLFENKSFREGNKLDFIVFNRFDSSLITYQQGNKLMEIIDVHYKDVTVIKSYSNNYDELNRHLMAKLPITVHSICKRDLLWDLEGFSGVFLTFLSPGDTALHNLMVEWDKDNTWQESKKGEKGETGEITNKSSIVCLIEKVNGSSKETLLLTGDGYIEDIRSVLDSKKIEWGVSKIDCVKLPHHGSLDNNKGIKAFVDEYGCKQTFYMSHYNVEAENVIRALGVDVKVFGGIANRDKEASIFKVGAEDAELC